MAVETVRIEMLGTAFVIQTDESEQYINSLLAYYQAKLDAIGRDSRVQDPLKQAILASVYIIDELFRARVDNSLHKDMDADIGDELSAIAQRLIARIDHSLIEPAADPSGSPAPTDEWSHL
ncbi:MAG: hypothetical protein A2087_03670 [Spirochaetes bacterium GWD1_61_31]|nr:MAG: hypothetical protein A2Y37_01045 [Spirochaetes bacterium GWB1_60_80]OHD30978.1 MAG: hypothetical protein A2004_06785 [Spirochaetes bacterium GWC1_61_12]OHD36190.1 MAG: hypothetical protein A2087_03670 [Spirochaetes bacterium GWD1_61_31]OHD43254.1 MAG: hypothetical protein A2Y35_08490 [Spirochaetes bacterium GWE1_60_18]OHD58814.1 MAG: hypothetical protein A2Y32_01325 [Spirochaetes bacterium GWF1_60_12]